MHLILNLGRKKSLIVRNCYFSNLCHQISGFNDNKLLPIFIHQEFGEIRYSVYFSHNVKLQCKLKLQISHYLVKREMISIIAHSVKIFCPVSKQEQHFKVSSNTQSSNLTFYLTRQSAQPTFQKVSKQLLFFLFCMIERKHFCPNSKLFLRWRTFSKASAGFLLLNQDQC